MRTDLKFKILFSGIDVFLQTTLCVFLHDGIVSYYSRHFYSIHDLSWGIGIEIVFVGYVFLVLLQNIAIIIKEKRAVAITTIISVLYMLILIDGYKYHPLKTLNLLIVGLFCIWLKLLFDRLFVILFKKSKKITN
jgi:hypothetical protein